MAISQRRIANDERPASSHAQLIGRFQWRSAAAADDGRAIATGQRIANFHGADRAVEHDRRLPVRRWFWSDLHEHETVTQFSGARASLDLAR